MELPTGAEVSLSVHLAVGIIWAVSMVAYIYAARNETIVSFRPMRIYAAILSGMWAAYGFYVAAAFMEWVPAYEFIVNGLLSGTLLIPSAGFLIAQAWVTHKVVRSWE